jgi:hypothetical protein
MEHQLVVYADDVNILGENKITIKIQRHTVWSVSKKRKN